MASWQLTLEIPDWDGEGPIEALHSFLGLEDPIKRQLYESLSHANGPDFLALEWDALNREDGRTFHVLLDDGLVQNLVSLEGPHGQRIPLKYVPALTASVGSLRSTNPTPYIEVSYEIPLTPPGALCTEHLAAQEKADG